jgi:hypothetical protein
VEGEIVSVITPERADLFLDLLRDRHGANATRTEERRELAQRQPSPEEMTAGFIVCAAIAHALPDQDLAIQVAIDGTAAAFRFSEYAERFDGDREYPAGSRDHWAALRPEFMKHAWKREEGGRFTEYLREHRPDLLDESGGEEPR